jgi:hypothetical protein
MALLPGAEQYLTQSPSAFWREQLANCRVLLDQTNQAITKLQAQNIQEYTIDSGQTLQRVRHGDSEKLQALIGQRDALLAQIAVLEARLSVGGSHAVRVVPAW